MFTNYNMNPVQTDNLAVCLGCAVLYDMQMQCGFGNYS
jgi:hypothetical protein